MGKILAKQVVGSLDTTSEQVVEGKKTFSAPVVFQKKKSTHSVINQDGFIYWVKDQKVIEQEGNYRIGVVNSALQTQYFLNGNWENSGK